MPDCGRDGVVHHYFIGDVRDRFYNDAHVLCYVLIRKWGYGWCCRGGWRRRGICPATATAAALFGRGDLCVGHEIALEICVYGDEFDGVGGRLSQSCCAVGGSCGVLLPDVIEVHHDRVIVIRVGPAPYNPVVDERGCVKVADLVGAEGEVAA